MALALTDHYFKKVKGPAFKLFANLTGIFQIKIFTDLTKTRTNAFTRRSQQSFMLCIKSQQESLPLKYTVQQKIRPLPAVNKKCHYLSHVTLPTADQFSKLFHRSTFT